MAEDRIEQQDQQSEFARQGQQSQSERQENGQQPFVSPEGNEQPSVSSAAGSGQPLGGTDSATGTGTTLSQGFESSGDETLIQSGSSEDTLNRNAGGESAFSDTDRQGSGFIGAQGSGSDDYLQQSQNPELSREDALDQQEDDGMGLAGSEQDQGNG
jgi:hypothetical protein